MPKQRTTHGSSSGTTRHAIRDAEGRFLDIQMDARAHRADLAQQCEAATANKKGDRV
jgi:hypothetical protein